MSDASKQKYHEGIAKALPLLKIVDKQQLLDSFDMVISDFEGVVWNFVDPIPNVDKAIMLLRKAGKSYKFVASHSTRSDGEYLSLLKKMGVDDVKDVDIVHPAKSMSRYLLKFKLGKKIYSVGSQTFNEALSGLIPSPPFLGVSLENLEVKLRPEGKIGAVVADLNFNLTYGQLARAQQYLLDANCSLLVGETETYTKLSNTVSIIGNAGFIDILRRCTKSQPVMLSKPSPLVIDDIVELYNLKDRKRVLFIGGSLINDIQFAINGGFQTLFVLTGFSTNAEMLRLPDNLKPDYVTDSLGDFVKFFEQLQQSP